MSTTLTLVRHGETIWNSEGRIQGVKNSPLTESGIRQAEATARALAGRHFDAIYSSPLGRAKKTAEIFSESVGCEIRFDQDLQERNLGVLQGLTIDEIEDQFPDVFAAFRSGDPNYVVPKGESSRQRFERGCRCIQKIADANGGKKVLVVTHGGIIDSVFRRIFDLSLKTPRHHSAFNCAINIISVAGDDWQLFTWGDIHHLEEIGSLDDE